MASTYKVLGQAAPAQGALTDLYAVPVARSAVTSTLMVCNQSAYEGAFRVSVAIAAAADTPAQYLHYDVPIRANDSLSVTIGATLAATDVVRVTATRGALSFNLFGQELS